MRRNLDDLTRGSCEVYENFSSNAAFRALWVKDLVDISSDTDIHDVLINVSGTIVGETVGTLVS